MRNKTLLILLFLITTAINSIAQYDSLTIFTKATCSNCNYAKTQFRSQGISYKEYPLEQQQNADEMIKRLRLSGYKGKILLPVIFLNTNIYHPATNGDTSLIRISLYDAIDSIKNFNKTGRIHLNYSEQIVDIQEAEHTEGDCEIQFEPTYLICGNFKEKEKAIAFIKELKQSGYIEADVLNYKNFYRVYCKILNNPEANEKELFEIRKKHKTSYLLNL